MVPTAKERLADTERAAAALTNATRAAFAQLSAAANQSAVLRAACAATPGAGAASAPQACNYVAACAGKCKAAEVCVPNPCRACAASCHPVLTPPLTILAKPPNVTAVAAALQSTLPKGPKVWGGAGRRQAPPAGCGKRALVCRRVAGGGRGMDGAGSVMRQGRRKGRAGAGQRRSLGVCASGRRLPMPGKAPCRHGWEPYPARRTSRPALPAAPVPARAGDERRPVQRGFRLFRALQAVPRGFCR